jgi:hypothetical protein
VIASRPCLAGEPLFVAIEKKSDRPKGKRRFGESDVPSNQCEAGFLLRRRARCDREIGRPRYPDYLSMSLYRAVATSIRSLFCL